MIMTNHMSKLVLTAHVAFSIRWLGAVAVFLALAITSLNSQNEQLVRACLLAMKISAWFVILPFCLTALATSIMQAAWTKWGLFRYYWIVEINQLSIKKLVLAKLWIVSFQ
jgi:hypothetical protein